MRVDTQEIMDGKHDGSTFWICQYNRPDLDKKPLRNVPPTKAMVFSNQDLPKGKAVYYSHSHFRPIGKNGKPASKIIGVVDNTDYRHRQGTPIDVFTCPYLAKDEWNRQLSEHIKMVQGRIDGAVAYWEQEKSDLESKMFFPFQNSEKEDR